VTGRSFGPRGTAPVGARCNQKGETTGTGGDRDGYSFAAAQLVGGTPAGVWTIKHLISPLDRRLYRRTHGRLVTPGHPRGPIVLLTTIGRRTGNQHTTPVFHLQDRERIIVCNVTPSGERPNPWTLNLRAQPLAQVQLGAQVQTYRG
jgi:F420H(2)-dependent quinone reductase